MKKIILSVKRGKFRADDPNSVEHDKEFVRMRDEVLKRDDYRCGYCNFKALKFQDVHHLDDDHANNDKDNLITACAICHMCHHIAFAGIKEMGTLIYLDPSLGITQQQLNALTRSLWLAQDSKNQEISSMAVEVYYRLFFKSTLVKNILGDANPTSLGNYLMSLSDSEYHRRGESLKGIYLLPSKEGFIRQYRYWRETFKGAMPGKWESVAIQNISKWYNIENDSADMRSDQLIREFLERKDGS